MTGAWQAMVTIAVEAPIGPSAPAAGEAKWDLPLFWAALPLVLALLLAAAIIAWAKKWQQRATGPEILTANAQLAHFRSLYERGDMSEAEFARVRALLAERLKKEMAWPTAPPAGSSPPQPGIQPFEGSSSPPTQEGSNDEVKPGDLPTPPREQSP